MCIGFILPIVISCPFSHIEGLLCRFRPAEPCSSFVTRPENISTDVSNNHKQSVLTSNPVPPLPRPLHHHHQYQYQHRNVIHGDNRNVHYVNHNNNNGSSSEARSGHRAGMEEPSSQSFQQMSVLTYQELSPRSSVPVPTPAPVSPAKDRIRPVTGNIDSDIRHSCDQSQNDRNSSFIRTSGTVVSYCVCNIPIAPTVV